jgi:hypothetical protein
MARLRWPLLLVSALFTALFIAWQVLSSVNFLYPFWHSALDIGDTVRVYGPQNRHRHGFERTTAAEHARLFAAIVRGVENGGRGLENLRYRAPNGRPIARLLTPPEIIHLQDVSRLIRGFQFLGWTSLLIFIAVAASLRLRPASRPAMKKVLAYAAGVGAAVTIVLTTFGAKNVFYKFHTWIFPTGHQWFFYYQDSLMTTLMKAPDLFAGIAVEWLALTIIMYGLLIAACIKLLPSATRP